MTPQTATDLQSNRSNRRVAVNELWLVRLRWVAVGGQLLTVAVAGLVFQVSLSIGPLLAIIGGTAVTNLLFAAWLSKNRAVDADQDHGVLVTLMTLDLCSLTALLFFSGGPVNPFTIFFLLNLALAAVLLPSRSAWMLTCLAMACLGLLFARHVEMPELTRPVLGNALPEWTLGRLGFVVAFAGCSGTVCYFITRVTRELRHREYELRLAEQSRARSERLEALATLAAGAGHELASPLSTIAVIANDLKRHLQGTSVPVSVIEDVRLIRGELDHCKEILDRLASSAGQAAGEVMQPIRVEDLVAAIVESLRRKGRVEVQLAEDVAKDQLVVPMIGISQAIRGLVRNGLDASGDDGTVRLRIDKLPPHWCRMVIADHGDGMPPEILDRAGEPFFTTKEPGKGMGLGIFLARNVIERLGGTFALESRPHHGTTATVKLALRSDEEREPTPSDTR